MCITFIFANPDDKSIKYKLILLSNRDEFLARKTYEAQLKSGDGNRQLIHGTDVSSSTPGTWLGISKDKNVVKIGNLLNVTGEKPRAGVLSRGPVVLDFIKSNDSIESHCQKLLADGEKINNFNFMAIEVGENGVEIFNTCNVTKKCQKIPNGENYC